MTTITADQLPSYTREEAEQEFGWIGEQFDRPGIYRWLEERMGCVSDFIYLGDMDTVPLPTMEDCVEEYGYAYDSVEEARAAIEQGWMILIEDGVLYHCILPDSCADQYIRVI